MYQTVMQNKRKKVSVIGSGFVGSTCAHWIAAKELADVCLIDINGSMAQGKALDLYESTPVFGLDSVITGGSDYSLCKNSDVVVITAGLPRKPGMSRDDLLLKNASIMKNVCENVKKYCPNAIVIVVSNPLDAMTYVAYETLGFEKNRVLGMAGVLDSARFRTFIHEKTNVSVKDIDAYVLGGHGDTMVPLTRHCYVGGIPLCDVLSEKEIDEIVDRTKKGGAEIVGLLKTGSAYFAPSASAALMVQSILKDEHRIVSAAVYLEGQYGVKDLFVGVPCQIGATGVEKVIELKLNDKEKKELDFSIKSVESLISSLKKMSY